MTAAAGVACGSHNYARSHSAAYVVSARAEPAVDVDHIKALADGGEPFDFDNLRSLCHACHSRVTRAWRTGGEPPVKGCTADGFPLNPRHWWHGK
jgi:5-methylcytosine-specific restriction endonuclease McrA